MCTVSGNPGRVIARPDERSITAGTSRPSVGTDCRAGLTVAARGVLRPDLPQPFVDRALPTTWCCSQDALFFAVERGGHASVSQAAASLRGAVKQRQTGC